jgi:hypothetical protein
VLGKIASKYVNMKHGQNLARHKLTCPALGKVTFKKVLKTGLLGVNWVVTYITKQIMWVV